jgi:hypothetical protein
MRTALKYKILIFQDMTPKILFVNPEGNRVSMLEPIPVSWHSPKKIERKRQRRQ